MPYRPRDCEICTKQFVPPHRKNEGEDHLKYCPSCRRTSYSLDEVPPPSTPVTHVLGAPLKQLVFDIETWGLDRGWGVTLVYSRLLHGGPNGPEKKTITLREYGAWAEGKRSDDHDFVADVLEDLYNGHILYAHNGERFDVRWLRSVALRYGLEMPKVKLIDPCQIAWRKYLLGRNSLEALADFLRPRFPYLKWDKMHIPPDTWRQALLDGDNASWDQLVQRCESDVEVLNSVASCVTGDVGLIDYSGSYR